MAGMKDFLKNDESLFLNPIVLDYDYQPKLVLYRENLQHYIASCIKPLFQSRNGKNLFIFGPPGVGKTLSSKHVLKELQEYEDSIYLLYINCWKYDTSFRVVNELCKQIGYKFTHNKRTDELIDVISIYVNKKSAVIVLDEIDKLKDFDALYSLIEDIHKKTILTITNNKDWLINLDKRLRSRLNLEEMEFKSYTLDQTKGILKQRLDIALVSNCMNEDLLNLIVNKCYDVKDIRSGLFLIKDSAEIAELESSKIITLEHVKKAIDKFDRSRLNNSTELEKNTNFILDLIKENSGSSIKEIYEVYKKKGGDKAYVTFHRRINDLKKIGVISTQEVGNEVTKSYIVKYIKKLDEF